MTNNKPEWFEIAEQDGPVKPTKASKALPLAAVFATALILGVGAVVGQVQDGSSVVAVDTASIQTEATSGTTSSTPVASNSQAVATTVASNSQSSSVTRIANPAVSSAVIATAGLQNPSIAQLPTKGGDDDDDEDDDEDDDDDDDEEDDD